MASAQYFVWGFRLEAEDPVGELRLHKCHCENCHSQENRHEGVRVAREIQVDHDVVTVLSISLDGPDLPKV